MANALEGLCSLQPMLCWSLMMSVHQVSPVSLSAVPSYSGIIGEHPSQNHNPKIIRDEIVEIKGLGLWGEIHVVFKVAGA